MLDYARLKIAAPCGVVNGSSQPAVSVIMPMLNAARFLEEAIESVLAQDAQESLELLIVDDGSTDGSDAIASRYAKHYPERIFVLRHPGRVNRGASAARNLGLQCARAPLIGFLDADDVWLPGMLRKQLALLQQYPDAAMVYANAERTWDMTLPFLPIAGVSKENEVPRLLPAGVRPGLFAPSQSLAWWLDDETLAPCTCTVLVRTEAAREVGGFVETFEGLYDDQAFYAKLLLKHPVAMSTECVARYRQHTASCCAQVWHDDASHALARAKFLDWLARYRTVLSGETGCLATA